MVNKGKLKMALAAEKGVDFSKLHQKKVHKQAIKRNKQRASKKGGAQQDSDSDEWEDEVEGGAPVDEDDEEDSEVDSQEEEALGMALNDESDSDDSIVLEEKIERKPKTILKAKNVLVAANAKKPAGQEEEDDDEEDDEDIPLSDLEDLADEDKEDLVSHTRLTINNTSALLGALKRIAIPTDKSVPFATHQCLVGENATAAAIEDVQDDVQRELAFYNQSLQAARRARALLKAENVPFSRPTDYFAEMVKDDGHMEKVKEKMIQEASAKKASAEARKQRELKKFGKQVQVNKLQERNKAKKEALEKINTLKRKRQESGGDAGGDREADLFDVGVDAELSKHAAREKRTGGRDFSSKDGGGGGGGGKPGAANNKRQKKNEKFGFGGKKKHSKSNDAASSNDLSGFNAKRMKTGGGGPGGAAAKKFKAARPGKARRNAGKR